MDDIDDEEEEFEDDVDDEEDIEDDEPAEDPPTAIITTDPPDAPETALDLETTVTLDASESTAGSNSITEYLWDVGAEGEYREEGETIDVTISACGEFPVILCVRDEAGLSDVTTITLRTG